MALIAWEFKWKWKAKYTASEMHAFTIQQFLFLLLLANEKKTIVKLSFYVGISRREWER